MHKRLSIPPPRSSAILKWYVLFICGRCFSVSASVAKKFTFSEETLVENAVFYVYFSRRIYCSNICSRNKNVEIPPPTGSNTKKMYLPLGKKDF
jgi:hypothetical protein